MAPVRSRNTHEPCGRKPRFVSLNRGAASAGSTAQSDAAKQSGFIRVGNGAVANGEMMPTFVQRTCAWCEKPFQAPLKEANRGKGNFCSVSCANAKRSSGKKVEGARTKWIESVQDTQHYKAQRKAHHAVEEAVKRGRLHRQPCAVCGSTDRIHAHHDDYAKPLDVQWLCVVHHRQHHG